MAAAPGANARLPASPNPLPAMTLPDVVVPGGTTHNPGHYKVPAGYDSDVSLHPYTSGLGPCTEGAAPSTGCRHPTILIQPSHYERAPFKR
jgi:hypothetical protein